MMKTTIIPATKHMKRPIKEPFAAENIPNKTNISASPIKTLMIKGSGGFAYILSSGLLVPVMSTTTTTTSLSLGDVHVLIP
jgi:hypothetical protein